MTPKKKPRTPLIVEFGYTNYQISDVKSSANCKFCSDSKTNVKSVKCGSSNYLRHLKRIHPDKAAEYLKGRKSRVPRSADSCPEPDKDKNLHITGTDFCAATIKDERTQEPDGVHTASDLGGASCRDERTHKAAVDLVPKKKMKTPLVVKFGYKNFHDSDDGSSAICKFCRYAVTLVTSTYGRSRNYLHHLRRFHPDKADEYKHNRKNVAAYSAFDACAVPDSGERTQEMAVAMTLKKKTPIPPIVEFGYTNYQISDVKSSANCKFCSDGKTNVKSVKNTASNYLRHLKRIHPDKAAEYQKGRKSRVPRSADSCPEPDKDKNLHKTGVSDNASAAALGAGVPRDQLQNHIASLTSRTSTYRDNVIEESRASSTPITEEVQLPSSTTPGSSGHISSIRLPTAVSSTHDTKLYLPKQVSCWPGNTIVRPLSPKTAIEDASQVVMDTVKDNLMYNCTEICKDNSYASLHHANNYSEAFQRKIELSDIRVALCENQQVAYENASTEVETTPQSISSASLLLNTKGQKKIVHIVHERSNVYIGIDPMFEALASLLSGMNCTRTFNCPFCSYCNYDFKYVQQHVYQKHLSSEETNSGMFHCPHCKFVSIPEAAPYHLKKHHSDDRSHCRLSSPVLSTNSQINSAFHLPTHNGSSYKMDGNVCPLHEAHAAVVSYNKFEMKSPSNAVKNESRHASKFKIHEDSSPVKFLNSPDDPTIRKLESFYHELVNERSLDCSGFRGPWLDRKSICMIMIMNVLGERPCPRFHSPVCGYNSTELKSGLQRHLLRCHLAAPKCEDGMIACPHCIFRCDLEEVYRKHLYMKHWSCILCPHCNKEFSTIPKLNAHLDVHISPFDELGCRYRNKILNEKTGFKTQNPAGISMESSSSSHVPYVNAIQSYLKIDSKEPRQQDRNEIRPKDIATAAQKEDAQSCLVSCSSNCCTVDTSCGSFGKTASVTSSGISDHNDNTVVETGCTAASTGRKSHTCPYCNEIFSLMVELNGHLEAKHDSYSPIEPNLTVIMHHGVDHQMINNKYCVKHVGRPNLAIVEGNGGVVVSEANCTYQNRDDGNIKALSSESSSGNNILLNSSSCIPDHIQKYSWRETEESLENCSGSSTTELTSFFKKEVILACLRKMSEVVYTEEKKLYQCPLCKEKRKIGWRLFLHMMTQHLSHQTYDNGKCIKCPHCDFSFPLDHQFLEHMNKVHRRNYCYQCPFKHSREQLLFDHIVSVHFEEFIKVGEKKMFFVNAEIIRKELQVCLQTNTIQQCPFCPFNNTGSACLRKTLQCHLFRYHLACERTAQKNRNIKCCHCTSVFQSDIVYRMHIRKMHHGYVYHYCPFCPRRVKQLNSHMIEVHGSMIGIPKCSTIRSQNSSSTNRVIKSIKNRKSSLGVGKGSKYERMFASSINENTSFHKKEVIVTWITKVYTKDLHIQKQKHKCPFCRAYYQCRLNLLLHVMTQHLSHENGCKGNKIKCPHCNDCFLLDKPFFVHMNSVHQYNDRDLCPQCPFVSPSLQELYDHTVSTHFLELKNVNKSRRVFASAERIGKKLLLLSQRANGYRQCPFCHFCSSRKRQRCGLRAHLFSYHLGSERTSTGAIKCCHCPKEFRSNIVYRDHVKMMHQEKGFQFCPFCPCKVKKLNAHLIEAHGSAIVLPRLKYTLSVQKSKSFPGGSAPKAKPLTSNMIGAYESIIVMPNSSKQYLPPKETQCVGMNHNPSTKLQPKQDLQQQVFRKGSTATGPHDECTTTVPHEQNAPSSITCASAINVADTAGTPTTAFGLPFPQMKSSSPKLSVLPPAGFSDANASDSSEAAFPIHHRNPCGSVISPISSCESVKVEFQGNSNFSMHKSFDLVQKEIGQETFRLKIHPGEICYVCQHCGEQFSEKNDLQFHLNEKHEFCSSLDSFPVAFVSHSKLQQIKNNRACSRSLGGVIYLSKTPSKYTDAKCQECSTTSESIGISSNINHPNKILVSSSSILSARTCKDNFLSARRCEQSNVNTSSLTKLGTNMLSQKSYKNKDCYPHNFSETSALDNLSPSGVFVDRPLKRRKICPSNSINPVRELFDDTGILVSSACMLSSVVDTPEASSVCDQLPCGSHVEESAASGCRMSRYENLHFNLDQSENKEVSFKTEIDCSSPLLVNNAVLSCFSDSFIKSEPDPASHRTVDVLTLETENIAVKSEQECLCDDVVSVKSENESEFDLFTHSDNITHSSVSSDDAKCAYKSEMDSFSQCVCGKLAGSGCEICSSATPLYGAFNDVDCSTPNSDTERENTALLDAQNGHCSMLHSGIDCIDGEDLEVPLHGDNGPCVQNSTDNVKDYDESSQEGTGQQVLASCPRCPFVTNVGGLYEKHLILAHKFKR